MGSEKINILFCNAYEAPYVEDEKKLFKELFNVIFYEYKISNSLVGKFKNILSNYFTAVTKVHKANVVYGMFGGFHCFFPFLIGKLLRKKLILFIGGYDGVSIPSIEYGAFYRRNLLYFIIKWELKWADIILPVDESLVSSINKYADPSGNGYITGICNHFAGLESKIRVIPFGFSPEKFSKQMEVVRKKEVVSTGWAKNLTNYYRKGFDLVIEAANHMPSVNFTIAGLDKNLPLSIGTKIPENVRIHGFLSHNELVKLYSESKVFLQLSLSEGLPNTLCEAMLCECIPIGSNVNGIPKAIGNAGFILPEKDVNKLADLIHLALQESEDLGELARKKISDEFPTEKRIQEIFYVINECMANQ